MTAKMGIREGAVSAVVFGGVMFALVSVDPRVRDQVTDSLAAAPARAAERSRRRSRRRALARGAGQEHRRRAGARVRDRRRRADGLHVEDLVPQPLVLAIEPDLRQAAIVKRIVREKVLADVAVVDSRDAALEAMRTTHAGRPAPERADVAARRGRADRAPAHARATRTTCRPTRSRSSPRRSSPARSRGVARAAVGVPPQEGTARPRRRAAIRICSRKRSASSCSAPPTRSASGPDSEPRRARHAAVGAPRRHADGRGTRRRRPARAAGAVLVVVVAVRVETHRRPRRADTRPRGAAGPRLRDHRVTTTAGPSEPTSLPRRTGR